MKSLAWTSRHRVSCIIMYCVLVFVFLMSRTSLFSLLTVFCGLVSLFLLCLLACVLAYVLACFCPPCLLPASLPPCLLSLPPCLPASLSASLSPSLPLSLSPSLPFFSFLYLLQYVASFCSILSHLSSAEDSTNTNLVAVGLWTDISVRILKVPNFEQTFVEMLGGGNVCPLATVRSTTTWISLSFELFSFPVFIFHWRVLHSTSYLLEG